jgi:uncharacterized protein (TIGR02996 family)
MSDREALLLGIRTAPDDDLPRLAYADWLEENGDPDRAEYIRLQCRLAKLDSDEYDHQPLQVRAWKLEEANRQRWQAELPVLRGIQWDSYRRRGLVESVSASSYKAFVTHAGAIRQAIHLRGLSLDLASGFRTFRAPECLAGLEELWLWGRGGLHPDCVRALARCAPLAGLKALYLSGQGVQTEGVVELAGSPHLAWLERLSLNANPATGPMGAASLARSPHLTRLTDLDLFNNQLGNSGLAYLAQMDGLRRLMLNSNSITDDAIVLLAHSPHMANLRQLSLDDNRIGAAGVAALAGSSVLQALHRLSLSGNSIGDSGAAALARWSIPAPLTSLSLDRTGITAKGASALAASPALAGLRWLYIGGNTLGDEGAAAIARSPLLGQLVTLNLSSNDIGDAGARVLLESPYLGRIRWLFYDGNHISPPLFRALQERFGQR